MNRNAMTKAAVLAVLMERGITRVEVEYSGGNDEGGVDSISFYKGEDEIVVPEPRRPNGFIYEASSGKWVQETKGFTPEELREGAFFEGLEAPIYAKYDSFAGEFYANGKVIWDVAAGTCKMEGYEEEPQGTNFEEEF